MKVDGLDESTWSTRLGTPQLSGYEENILPRGLGGNNDRYAELPECPISIDTIEYVEKKHGRTIKNLPREVSDVLKSDEIYGKSTLTSNRMMKPFITAKVNSGEITLEEANENKRNFIYWNTVYKGVRWARFESICEKWGVKLEKIE